MLKKILKKYRPQIVSVIQKALVRARDSRTPDPKELDAIRQGDYRTYESPILMQAGEKCIFACSDVIHTERTKSGKRNYVGEIAISDRCVYFASDGGGARKMLLSQLKILKPATGGFTITGTPKNMCGNFLLSESVIGLETLRVAIQIGLRLQDPHIAGGRTRHIPQSVKHEVWHRDGGKCKLCGSNDRIHYDHIIPYSKGGSNGVENIQILCDSCNLSKGDRI